MRDTNNPTNREPLRRRLSLAAAVAGATALATLPVTVNTARAQAGGDESVLEEVTVTGIRAATANALSRQRNADNLVSALSTDDIGNFPDQNVAEATRRLPGISVENDQGEGRFVIIRGIDPNLNTTTINGFSVPSPQRDGRQVALDVIPSDLVSAIVVTKLPTASMDGDAIGGSIDVETLNPLEREGLWFSSRVEGGYSDLTDDFNPKLSFTGGTQSDDGRLGVAGAISWSDRDFGSDNIEIDGGFRDNDSPSEPEFRNYTISRERLGVALNVDFRAADNTLLYVKSLYSDFDDFEARQRTEFAIRDADAVTVNNGVTRVTDNLRVDRDQRARRQRQKIYAVQSGIELDRDVWSVDIGLGYARAEEDETDRLSTEFRRTFGQADSPDFLFEYDARDPKRPRIGGANSTTQALLQSAQLFELDGLEYEDNRTRDEEWAAHIDIARELQIGGRRSEIQFGAKVRLRDKDNDQSLWAPDELPTKADGSPYTAADFAQSADYGLGDFGPAIGESAVRREFEAIARNGELDVFESFAADYDASEDIYAGYVQALVEFDRVRVTGGIRVERTEFSSTGFLVGEDLTSIRDDNSYTNVLPSLVAVFEPREDLIVRAGYARTLSRPLVDAAVTRIAIDDEDADIGNAQLDPFVSDNLDITIEYYPGRFSVLSAGLFYKDISDFIVDQDIIGTAAFAPFADNPAFEDVTSAIQAQNAASAELLGIELNAQHAFDNLPAPFDGLIVAANYTYSDGETELADGRKVPLPRQSENLASATIGYEKDGISVRLAMAYRSRYLEELDSEGFRDRFVESHLQYDLTAKYDISDQLQIYAEWINIDDRPYHATFDGKRYLAQIEEYGWSAAFGLKFTY
ncbi:TonB-dependent receptor [Exilibacterium tricleocarpae]|uniref:TonB-dependent receptor n=1 Tax=Exilibacterium tricleocarpae TaxID=2591008 RepID=A0A545TAM3_9GAMM|nr:TonB-dependent receptor [Exilibacterium tricleocarpae]TQV74272.1 TonB-dependent receptor [Exilibacterium tricleocarpae]